MKYSLILKQQRKKKKISQVELAEKLGIKQEQISRYENGIQEPTIGRLIDIAEILDLTVNELIEYKQMHDEYFSELAKKVKDEE